MPKIEAYALLQAVRQVREHPESAGEIYAIAAIFAGTVYFCRRFVFNLLTEKYPRTAQIISWLGTLAGYIVWAMLAALLIFIVYTFCSNLFNDITAAK